VRHFAPLVEKGRDEVALQDRITMTTLETFETYRPLLFSIAYRMLGSAMEAEDMVQETFVRFQTVSPDSLQSAKAYLTTIITRLCLDELKSARSQREQYVGMWLPEPIQTDDAPFAVMSQHESIALAFLVLMEHLSPIERAVYLLRTVFDYSYSEIADILGKSEANCRRYFHNAKTYLHEKRPRFTPASSDQQRIVEQFMAMLATGDTTQLTHLLAEDATLYGDGGGKVPSIRKPLVGRDKIIKLFMGLMSKAPEGTRAEIAQLNGEIGIIIYFQEEVFMVTVISIENERIHTLHNILNPDKLAYLRKSSERRGTSTE
jgi:RNA polymerase sigma-70 factor (ECF subfamily)